MKTFGYKKGKISISQEVVWANNCRFLQGRRTSQCWPRAPTFLQRQRGMEARRKERIVVAFLLLLLLGAVIVLAAVLGAKSFFGEACPGKTLPHVSSQTLDVAIVGGGLAGTYAAYKMRTRGLYVHLFEHSNRIGGRLYTRWFTDNSKAELGAGQYIPRSQDLMTRIVQELQLETEDAPEHHAGNAGMHYVRGRHLRGDQLVIKDIPYTINPDEPIMKTYKLDQYMGYKILPHILGYRGSHSPLAWQMKRDNSSAYTNSWRHFLRSILKAEEYNALHDLSFPFRSIYNHDISLPLPMMAVMHHARRSSQPGSLKTIKQGMHALPITLAKRFSAMSNIKHRIKLNHRLSEIKKDGEDYILRFIRTKTTNYRTMDTKEEVFIRAKRVILAVSRRALDLIDWEPFRFDEKMRRYSKATHDNKAFKLFLKYKTKWWKSNLTDVNTIWTDLPLVQTTEYTNSSVLMAAYCDDTCVSYWEPLTEGESCSVCMPNSYNVTDTLLREAKHQLSQLYNIKTDDIPEPEAAIAHSWSADPIGCAFSLYKPGYNWTEVMHYMAKPFVNENIHIIGSSFAEHRNTIWAEGALQTADNLLRNYFPWKQNKTV